MSGYVAIDTSRADLVHRLLGASVLASDIGVSSRIRPDCSYLLRSELSTPCAATRSTLRLHVGHVPGMVVSEQVVRVHAESNVAGMADVQSFGYRTDPVFVGPSVRRPRCSRSGDLARCPVASVHPTHPYPALVIHRRDVREPVVVRESLHSHMVSQGVFTLIVEEAK